MIGKIVDLLLFIGLIISVITSAYYITISIFGWYRKKPTNPDDYPLTKRFAVIIAAHNEEKVIENTIKTLKKVDYPSDLIDVYMVADNCTDSTAELGRKAGAIVYERTNNEKRGKGFAITWILERLWKVDKTYDAVCLLDADNLVDRNYFKEMNKSLHMGYKVVQGYLGCKNPEDSWISGCYSITYWLNNRLFQLSRYQIGLSCGIGGTGFVVDADLLKQIGWDSYCLTEDLEFQLKIVSRDMKVAWNHDAVFYDEKPITLKQSIVQRTRWMQGHSDCVTRFFWKLVKKSFKDKDFVALDTAFYLVQAYMLAIVWIISLISFVYCFAMGFTDPQHWLTIVKMAGGMMLLMCAYSIFLFIEKKMSWKIFLYLLIFPFYLYTWLVPIIVGWKKRKENVWVHTKHTRALELQDML